MGEIKTISQIIQEVVPYYKKKGGPEEKHTLVYDSSTETLEPVYFFILDLMNEMGLSPEKISDNFASSPGSGHFSELGQKASVMQQQGAKLLGDINIVLRSVLNIIYDLKEFRIRFQSYDDLNSKDKDKSDSARMSLKQLWMDKVDIAKGNSSIKGMALGQAGFQTLLDAFLIARDEKEADKLDLNDRIKRIVKSRVQEFNAWVGQSENELRKRYALEKSYLQSQVNSLKLYSRWAKPYLRAAAQLEMKEFGNEPALVKIFNTLLLELVLFGKSKINVLEAIASGTLPPDFKKLNQKREYYGVVLVEFKFRGIPQKVGQHYSFGGRSEITFSAYALNDEELKMINQELEKSDVNDVLALIEGSTGQSLEQMQKEINFFLEEKSEGEKAKEIQKRSGDNPFLALIGKYDKTEKKENKPEVKEKIVKIKPDNWIEKTYLRKLAEEKSKETAYSLFNIYKKSHSMPSYN